MIKFFRRIRRDLIEKNKIGSYLKYAIGEIILVVIGILIALSINNLNEDRILRKKEQTYLKGLQSEFLVSERKLENLLVVLRKNYEAAKDLLAEIGMESELDQEALLSQLGYDSFANEIAYSPNNAILNEMISSGSLREITNDELRRHLTTWNATLESVKVQEQGLRTEREKVRDMLRRENASIRTIFDHTGISENVLDIPTAQENFSNLVIMQSREFENNVLTFIITAISLEQEIYRPLLEEISAIRSLIDSELQP